VDEEDDDDDDENGGGSNGPGGETSPDTVSSPLSLAEADAVLAAAGG
jgi:hypothetical protein